MLISDFSFAVEHLDLAAEIASAVGALPAVATQDWCAKAAATLRRVRPVGVASVTLGGLGEHGEIIQFEATGGAGTDPQGRALEGDALHPERAESLDWWFDPTAPRSNAATALLRELPCAQRWATSASARRWSRLGVSDLVVGFAPVPGRTPRRMLIVELGIGPGERLLDHREAGIVRAVMPHLVQRASIAFGPDASTPFNRLTHREQQVLEQLALGKSVKQIAADLARSPHTVHDHVKSLHRKLNASSRGELIARALGHLTFCQGRSRSGSASVGTGVGSGSPGGAALLSA